MLPLPNLNFDSEVLKEYHTIDLQIRTVTETTSALKNEFAAMRTELLNLKAQVAALEESRNTLRAEMQALKAGTLAELRAVKAETVTELKIQRVQYEADLYRKFMDQQSASRQDTAANTTPQIEK